MLLRVNIRNRDLVEIYVNAYYYNHFKGFGGRERSNIFIIIGDYPDNIQGQHKDDI